MDLKKGYLYHIYNQGNNRQKIFFKEENYTYFLQKVNTHIKPYADIIAYCLMPNHFHFMLLVNEVEINIGGHCSGGTTLSRASTGTGVETKASTEPEPKTISINHSIGIMLASYTRAIHKQENMTGSLFRQKTKAECINYPKSITPSYITKKGLTKINITQAEKQYPQMCFNYIHQNPVKAGLVKNAEDWKYSSAKDYANMQSQDIINKEVASKYIKWELTK